MSAFPAAGLAGCRLTPATHYMCVCMCHLYGHPCLHIAYLPPVSLHSHVSHQTLHIYLHMHTCMHAHVYASLTLCISYVPLHACVPVCMTTLHPPLHFALSWPLWWAVPILYIL